MENFQFGVPLRRIPEKKARSSELLSAALAQRRHADYYLRFTQAHRSDFRTLDIERANINAALEYCLHTRDWLSAAGFITALSEFWVSTGLWDIFLKHARALSEMQKHFFSKEIPVRSGNQQHKTGDPHVPLLGVDSNSWFVMLGRMAEVEELRGNGHEALFLYRQQVQFFDEQNIADERVLVELLKRASRLAARMQEQDESRDLLSRCLQISRRQGTRKEEVEILLEFANLYRGFGDFEKVDLLCSTGLKISLSIGYAGASMEMLMLQGAVRKMQRLNEEAKHFYQRALEIAASAGDQRNVGELRVLLAEIDSVSVRKVFISYNHLDRSFVKQLAGDLRAAGLSVWWDEWEIKVGDSITQKVSEGIDRSAFLVAILSPNSVKAPWVQIELGSALMKQLSADRSIAILPVLIADCKVPTLIRDLKWADCRGDYRDGLKSLTDALFQDV